MSKGNGVPLTDKWHKQRVQISVLLSKKIIRFYYPKDKFNLPNRGLIDPKVDITIEDDGVRVESKRKKGHVDFIIEYKDIVEVKRGITIIWPDQIKIKTINGTLVLVTFKRSKIIDAIRVHLY